MIPLVAFLSISAPSAASSCNLIRPVAPDLASARRIAEVVLRNAHAPVHPYSKHRPYVLKVAAAQDDPNAWAAFQDLPAFHPHLRRGEMRVTAGGGGLSFLIDRCTGAVSHMYYSR